MKSFLLRFDAFRKISPELTSPTMHGAYLTMLAYFIMTMLFIFELHSYLSTNIIKTIELDTNYAEHIWIDFDIIMYELACKHTKVVVRDIIGHQELDVLDSKFIKEKIDVKTGTFKGQYTINDRKKDESVHPNDILFGRDLEERKKHNELDSDWESTSDHFKHENFENVLKYHDFTMINFYAEWCIHCRRFAPTWKDAELTADSMKFFDKNNDQVIVKLLRINCVDFGQICALNGIRAYPTVRMYKNDKTFTLYHGKREKENILEFVKDYVKNQDTGQHEIVTHHSIIEEGCRVHGELLVRRVPGYFLLEADSSIDSLEPSMTNVSHKVNHLWFVDNKKELKEYIKKTSRVITKDILKNVQPMKSIEFITYKQHMAPQHYLKVIPTVFDNKIVVYQSIVQSHIQEIETIDVPQARFSYTFSPLKISISSQGRPFYDFLTSLFAIIGGTYTFISLVDRFLDTVSTKYKRNINRLD